MINLYSGTPGSGKSLMAAYEIINLLKLKRNVIANFPIDLKYFGKRKIGDFVWLDNSELTVDFLMNYAAEHHKPQKEHQTTVFIDECSVIFNSRDYGRKDRMRWIVFFQQHRKLGFDVVLIAQSDRMIDRQIRAFIETEYKHRSIKNYKSFGWFLSLFCGGLFIQVETWYGMRLKCSSRLFRYNRKKASVYNTYQIFK